MLFIDLGLGVGIGVSSEIGDYVSIYLMVTLGGLSPSIFSSGLIKNIDLDHIFSIKPIPNF